MKRETCIRFLLILLILFPNNLSVKHYNFDLILHLPVKICSFISRCISVPLQRAGNS